MSRTDQNDETPIELPPYDPDDDEAITYLEGQPRPDPDAGWLKRLWYRFTGAIQKPRSRPRDLS